MLLLIDNYDSFTYNLYQYLCELAPEEEVVVRRNDRLSLEEIEALRPERIVVSPGPRGPADAGLSVDIIRRFGRRLPTFGVCLGHQCIGHAYGGRVVPAERLMHGKTSLVYHDGRGLMAGLPSPFAAVRYHSLAVEPESLPACLEVTARADDGTIMGLRHREHPVEGVQFHPESILTLVGKDLLRNFLRMPIPGQTGRDTGGRVRSPAPTRGGVGTGPEAGLCSPFPCREGGEGVRSDSPSDATWHMPTLRPTPQGRQTLDREGER